MKFFKEIINQPLYKVRDEQIFFSDIVNAFKKIGINKGDTIFVHSSVAVFGKLAGIVDRDLFLQNLIDALKESVGGNGTIIMPTFTYSFCNNELFDVQKSKSNVGVLTEYFRNLPDVKRTDHPIFSVAIWGDNKEDLLNVSKDSFGKDSIFDKLYKLDGKIVMFGAPFLSATFIHYIEQSYGVPYRFIKKFKGTIKKENQTYEDEVLYFVRHLDKNIEIDIDKLEKYFIEKGKIKESCVGNGRILMIKAKDYYMEGFKLLNKDIFSLLVKDHQFEYKIE